MFAAVSHPSSPLLTRVRLGSSKTPAFVSLLEDLITKWKARECKWPSDEGRLYSQPYCRVACCSHLSSSPVNFFVSLSVSFFFFVFFCNSNKKYLTDSPGFLIIITTKTVDDNRAVARWIPGPSWLVKTSLWTDSAVGESNAKKSANQASRCQTREENVIFPLRGACSQARWRLKCFFRSLL